MWWCGMETQPFSREVDPFTNKLRPFYLCRCQLHPKQLSGKKRLHGGQSNYMVILQIARFIGPTWGTPGFSRSQTDPMLAL